MNRDVFHAIADPTRRAILALIATQAMTPNTVAEHFLSTRQAVSKHIRVLAESQLLRQEKKGREIHYHFNPAKMKEVDEWLEQFKGLWDTRFSQLDDVLKNIKTRKK